MTTRIRDPITIYVGSEQTITTSVTIANGGTGRTFSFRVGPKGTISPYLNLTMTESNSSATGVDLSVTLSAANTAAILGNTDFQICTDSPKAVLAEGKIVLDYAIGAL